MTEQKHELTFNTQLGASVDSAALSEGYNEYGVKPVYSDDGELDRVEFIFEAMQPGERNGFEVTPEFLSAVAGKDYSSEFPFQMSHDKDQRSNAGFIDDVWFSSEAMRLHGYVPNTGNALRSDVIADLMHEPPALRDGSIGFGMDYDFEITDDDKIVLTDGRIQEFSATPFPGGYGKGGGLKAQFMADAIAAGVVDDDSKSGVSGSESARSQLKYTKIE